MVLKKIGLYTALGSFLLTVVFGAVNSFYHTNIPQAPATIDGTTINQQQFLHMLNNVWRSVQYRAPKTSLKDFFDSGYPLEILQHFVRRQVSRAEMEKQGFVVTEAILLKHFKQYPADLLNQQSPVFRRSLSEDIKTEALLHQLALPYQLPNAYESVLQKAANMERIFDLILFPFQVLPVQGVAQEEGLNLDDPRLMEEEYRTFEVVSLKEEDAPAIKQILDNEGDLKAFAQEHGKTYTVQDSRKGTKADRAILAEVARLEEGEYALVTTRDKKRVAVRVTKWIPPQQRTGEDRKRVIEKLWKEAEQKKAMQGIVNQLFEHPEKLAAYSKQYKLKRIPNLSYIAGEAAPHKDMDPEFLRRLMNAPAGGLAMGFTPSGLLIAHVMRDQVRSQPKSVNLHVEDSAETAWQMDAFKAHKIQVNPDSLARMQEMLR